jgi:hypothetical protein
VWRQVEKMHIKLRLPGKQTFYPGKFIQMFKLKFLKFTSTSPCKRFDQIDMDHFPKLQEIHYNYRGKYFKNKNPVSLPEKSILNRYSPEFKRLRLNFGRKVILHENYFLSKLNMDYIP